MTQEPKRALDTVKAMPVPSFAPAENPPAGRAEGLERGDYGWTYWNPDTGEEWAQNHPVGSGEVPDAERIRRATSLEASLAQQLAALAAPRAPEPVAEALDELALAVADFENRHPADHAASYESAVIERAQAYIREVEKLPEPVASAAGELTREGVAEVLGRVFEAGKRWSSYGHWVEGPGPVVARETDAILRLQKADVAGGKAGEALLNLLADADSWEEQADGDESGFTHWHELSVSDDNLTALAKACGLNLDGGSVLIDEECGYRPESTKEALERLIAAPTPPAAKPGGQS